MQLFLRPPGGARDAIRRDQAASVAANREMRMFAELGTLNVASSVAEPATPLVAIAASVLRPAWHVENTGALAM